MKMRLRALMLALAAIAAWLGYEVQNIPRPSREDEDYDKGLVTEEWSFDTEDGAVIRGKRYVNEGAQPIILAHGFLANGYEFDIPRKDRNLATYLARKGYDVWISSFRGNGREPYNSKAVRWGHSMDHLAAFDVPALIKGVKKSTGKRPVWIGHSMGGMVIYMYLQGASFNKDAGNIVFSADEALAKKRNRELATVIAIGSPPIFYWERGGFFGALSNSWIINNMLQGLDELLDNLHGTMPRISIGVPTAQLVLRYPRLMLVLTNHTPAGWVVFNPENVEPEVAMSLLYWAGDDVSSRMAQQGIRALVNRDFRSYDGSYSYTENMDRITVPFLFITGSKDAANANNIKRYGYEKVSSKKKDYVNLPGFGHTDLVMGKDVQEKVYPIITTWLDKVLRKK